MTKWRLMRALTYVHWKWVWIGVQLQGDIIMRTLYICPLPCWVIELQFWDKEYDD